MADTNFSSGVVIESPWLNDVNDFVYHGTPPGTLPSSANVSFIQSGTGAVARTVQSKLRESVSVLDFGAVGDGVTDDIAALQLAIIYLETYYSTYGRRSSIHFPPGKYLASSTLTLNSGSGGMNTLLGDGRYSSVIVYTGGGSLFTLANGTAPSPNALNIEIRDMGFSATAGGTCLDMPTYTYINRNSIKSNAFSGWTMGLNLINAWRARIHDNWFDTCSTGCIYMNGANGANITGNVLFMNSGYGLKITGSSNGISIIGNEFEDNQKEGLIFVENVTDSIVSGNYFERNGQSYGDSIAIRVGGSQDELVNGINQGILFSGNRSTGADQILLYNARNIHFDTNGMNVQIPAPLANMAIEKIRFSNHAIGSYPNTINSTYYPEVAYNDEVSGTWTPNVFGSGTAGTWTPTTAVGTYVKKAHVVTATCYIVGTLVGSTGHLRISLPLVPVVRTNYLPGSGPSAWGGITFSGAYTDIGLLMNNPGVASITVEKSGSGLAATPVQQGVDTIGTLTVLFTVTYEVPV